MYGYAYSLYNQVPFGRGGIDPAAAAYFTATGITGATQQTAIDNLVKGLKSDGLWSKMKAVYPFVTDNRNLLSYTNAFGNSYYITDGTSSFTPNNTTAPDGTNTGTRFTAIASNNNYFYSANTAQGQSFGTGNKTLSIYVKAGTFSGNIAISITSDGNTQSTVATLTNNWQRIAVTKNVIVAGGSPQYYIDLGGISMTAGQYFYIWGAQLENGTTATTYQPIATTQQAFISSQFKYNLVNPVDSDAAFRLVFNGGWTHSANGALPNGTNGYADTRLNANTNLTVSNFHLSFYTRTNNTATAFSNEIGLNTTYTASGWLALRTNNKTTGLAGASFGDDITEFVSASSTTAGFMVATETSSSLRKVFKNNSLLGQNTTTSSTAFLSANVSLSGPGSYSTNQAAFSTIGDGLTDTEAANLYTRVQAFQTALSRQV